MLFDKEEIKQRLGSDFTDGQAEKVAELMAAVFEELAKLRAAKEQAERQIRGLTAVQQHTQQEVKKLKEEYAALRRPLRRLAVTVGDCLDDAVYEAVKAELESRYGVSIVEGLSRGYLADARDKAVEVGVFGRGKKNGQEIMIIGESKRRIASKEEVDLFIWRKLNRLLGVYPNVFPLLVAQESIAPNLTTYIRDRGIAYYCPPPPPEVEGDEWDEET